MPGFCFGFGFAKRFGNPLPRFAMINRTGTTVVEVSSGVWEVTKTSADLDWSNSSAISAKGIAGDFILRFTPQQANKELMIGVNSDPLTNDHYNTIDHAIYFTVAGTVDQLYENGVASTVGSTPYIAGTNFFAKRTGSTLSIGFGGSDGVSGYTEKWSRTNANVLYVDSAILNIGAKVQVSRLK